MQISSFVNAVDFASDAAAERGVDFNLNYDAIITHNGEQRDSSLQDVKEHRRKYHDIKKSNLAAQFDN